MKEQRHTFLGLSKGNYITLGIFALASVSGAMVWSQTYGQTLQQVQNNKEAIQEIRKEMKSNTKDLRKEIKSSAKQTQSILKDQMQILIQAIKNQ